MTADLKRRMEGVEDALFGADRRSGVSADVTILMQVYRDLKRVAFAIFGTVAANLILTVIAILVMQGRS